MEDDNPRQGRPGYIDFDLEIGIGTGREYPVSVLDSPAGEARGIMHFPFDELALENRLLTLQNALLRSGGKHRRVRSPEDQAVQDFGQTLFDALISGQVRTCYAMSLREAARQDKGVRLRLRIRPPELSSLPWEFLYDPERAAYVSLSRQTPIVRYLESPRLIKPLTVTPPLRVLGMVASPQDLPVLDVEREKQRMERATQELRDRGLLELEWLPGQTSSDLQEAMWGGPWHIFHFIGHGGFDAQADEGFVALADSTGRMNPLNATRLARLLADHTDLRLVLLNACEGAKGGERDIYSSTASILVHRGIPAVVAMQYEITDRAAIDFARAFYRALAYGMAVDEAVVAARKAIDLGVPNTVEWGTPVLYMRTPDGVLFHVAEAPPPPPPLPPSSPPPSLYEEATAAMAVEDWPTAAEKLQAVLVQDPEHRQATAKLKQVQQELDLSALYTVGLSHYRAGRWQEAGRLLRQVQEQEPGYQETDRLLVKVDAELSKAEEPKRKWLLLLGGGLAALTVLVVIGIILVALGNGPEPTPVASPTLLTEVTPTGGSTLLPGATDAPTPAPEVTASPPPATTDTPVPTPVSPDAPLSYPTPMDPVRGQAWPWSDGSVTVYVPEGAFWMGSTDEELDAILAICGTCNREWFLDEQPQHEVTLDAFWIDRTEVTNAQYAAFLNAQGNQTEGGSSWLALADADSLIERVDGRYHPKEGYEVHPVVGVTWYGASAYCTWAGKRLPSEAEWEKAARGDSDTRIFPWGDEFRGDVVNFCDANCPLSHRAARFDDGYAQTAPVGSYEGGASPYGVLDMGGNVWEWIADWYDSDYYTDSPDRNPRGPESGFERVVRGGCWHWTKGSVRTADRDGDIPSTTRIYAGFRCAY